MQEFKDNADTNDESGQDTVADDGVLLAAASGDLRHFSSADREIIARVYRREGSRLRIYYAVALVACVLLGLGLFSAMPVDSIIVIAGGAVAGLVAWAVVIGVAPVKPGSWLYTQAVAGDRTSEEREILERLEG